MSAASSDKVAASLLTLPTGNMQDALRLSSVSRTDRCPRKDGDTRKQLFGSSSMCLKPAKRETEDSTNECGMGTAPLGYLDPRITSSCMQESVAQFHAQLSCPAVSNSKKRLA